MQSPGQPDNEHARLHALASYAVLDSDSERAFDDITRLVAHLLGVPIALISLVDTDRQWFKARYGLEVPEIPRRLSFCGHVVASGSPVIVEDADQDARFSDNPLVTGEPHVRFYAGLPLTTPDGLVLGSLCAIDHAPRAPTPVQLEMLAILARQVMYLLERRRAHLALAVDRQQAADVAARLAAMFDVMAEGVVVYDRHGAIVTHNTAANSILGLSDDQFRGRSSLDPRWRAVHEDGAPFPSETHPAMVALRTGRSQVRVVMGVHKPDDSLTWISINALPVRVVAGVVEEVVTTFHDITPLRESAERMAQQERLVTTGTLAAGVGHEINNPLAFVLGNLDLAVDELRVLAGPSPSARLRELLDMLQEARNGAERIRKIVRGLRALSREDVQLQPVDLVSVVGDSVSMAQYELRVKASVAIDVSGLPAVLGDESRLTQVLVNLLMNAGQAFTTANPAVNRVTVRGVQVDPQWVRLSVIDNGPGVPASVQGRIFDPFFTTKPVGEGTGLGLAVSKGIVAALGGQLTHEPVPGGGAAFHVTIPVAPSDEPMLPPVPGEAPTVRGRVLMIDDDVSVLTTMQRVLSRDHDVMAFSDPREALAAVADAPGFDVIFCDLMMPHLTGQELFSQVRAVRPEFAPLFVFVTGGATTAAVRVFLSALPNDVIEKPFRAADLADLARRYALRRYGG